MNLTLLAAFAACLALPAAAHNGVHIIDPYARVIGPSGSAYFRIVNHETTDDTLMSVTSPDAGMVMLMNDHADANGVMKMTDLPDGLTVKAEDSRLLASAADHVMLMNLTHKVKQGDTITLVLTFQNAGAVTVTLPVDNKRLTEPGAGPTPYDAESADNDGGVPVTRAQSTALTPDQQAITDVLMTQLDKLEARLTVDPIVVMGDAAVAAWVQGDTAGRALLARKAGVWRVTLLGGPDLRTPAFLAANGVAEAAMLSQMFNAAEDSLGADKVALSSKFPQVVLMPPPSSN